MNAGEKLVPNYAKKIISSVAQRTIEGMSLDRLAPLFINLCMNL